MKNSMTNTTIIEAARNAKKAIVIDGIFCKHVVDIETSDVEFYQKSITNNGIENLTVGKGIDKEYALYCIHPVIECPDELSGEEEIILSDYFDSDFIDAMLLAAYIKSGSDGDRKIVNYNDLNCHHIIDIDELTEDIEAAIKNWNGLQAGFRFVKAGIGQNKQKIGIYVVYSSMYNGNVDSFLKLI